MAYDSSFAVGEFATPTGYRYKFALAVASFIVLRSRPLIIGYAVLGASAIVTSVIRYASRSPTWWIGPVSFAILFVLFYIAAVVMSLRRVLRSGLFPDGHTVRVTLDNDRLLVSMGNGFGVASLAQYPGIRRGFGIVLLGSGPNTLTLPEQAVTSVMLDRIRAVTGDEHATGQPPGD